MKFRKIKIYDYIIIIILAKEHVKQNGRRFWPSQ